MFARIGTRLIVSVLLIGLVGVLQATALTEEEMLAVHEAARETLNTHDLDQYLSYWSDDAVFDFEPAHAPAEGKEAIRAFFESLFEGFPDFQVDKGRVMAGDNVLIVEHSTTGTHLGEWMGIPPTGVTTDPLPHIDIEEYDESGKVKRVTTYFDTVSLLVSIGQMPEPELPDLTPSFPLPDPEPTGLAPMEAEAELIARFIPHDLGPYARMIHPDAVFRYNTLGMLPLNREQTMAVNELFALSNSTLHGEVVRQFDLGNGWVASESIWRGVHDGPYFGIPASGNPVSVRAAGVSHYDADGLVTELNFYFDNLGVLTQIGAFPPPTPPELMLAGREEFANALETQDLDTIAAVWAEDGVWDYVPEPAPYEGIEQILAFAQAIFDVFPDYHLHSAVMDPECSIYGLEDRVAPESGHGSAPG